MIKKNNNILRFPSSLNKNERKVEAILFAASEPLDIETIEIDLMAGENRQEEHLKRNPSGQMPALELDNGDFIAEITAICEFLDEINDEEITIISKRKI